MAGKTKGINAERELLHLFWAHRWACIRVAGSGASRYPTPDILAGNIKRTLAIECKSSKGAYQYLDKEEVRNLRQFAKIFGAEPWVGVRFSNEDWRFFRPGELVETAGHHVIKRNSKGKSLRELINP